MRIRTFITCILLCILSFRGNAQNRDIDSLTNLLKNEKQDTSKLLLELKLCSAYNNTGDYLQGLNYGIRALEQARSLEKSVDSATVSAGRRGEARAYINIGNTYNDQGNYPQALAYYNKTLVAKEALHDKRGIADANNNIGLVYWSEGDYPVALSYFFKSGNMYVAIKHQAGIALSYNNIGMVYMDAGSLDSALSYYNKSLAIEEKRGNNSGIDRCYNNIGIIYHKQKKYIGALDYYLKSLTLRKEAGDMDGIAISYNNIASIYDDIVTQPDSIKKHYIDIYYAGRHLPSIQEVDRILSDSALVLHHKAIDMSERVGDQEAIAVATQGIGDAFRGRKDYTSALPYYLKSVAIYKDINERKPYFEVLENISECYEKLGRTDSALSYFKHAMAVKDSVFNDEKQKAIGREEVKYAYEKKQALAQAENKRRQAIADEQHKRQQLIIYAAIAGILLLTSFLFFAVKRLRITRKQKTIIERQKESLGNTLSQLGKAKQLLEEKHKDLTDSIMYARRIQTALLTSEKYLSENLREYFILFKPKDIVSGDFYWALHYKGKVYLACCDCTGHGVPGAFMSLLNITFLHQSVIEKGIAQPNEIFTDVRSNVITALNPDGTSNTKDGMDATLCAFDFEKHLLTAACANNPLWIVRNGELMEFKPDKIPIGIGGDDTKSFTLHEINLHKGDCVYMFSDGFADQFGGANGKKFKQSQLRELVVRISTLPMHEQKNIVEKTFNDWKGEQGQVDDVCVIGVKI